ncbi:helix-turn-helix domain-containing protein [Actinophytocola oryzae]|uniref:Helix-turn-helix protein n=1 Tax=Actinophytocola oryzae TaxID=502181 RepID=A0A4R7UT77_9PSEU|nr:helix-turn-helix domain-containing protein [Actinophytocola oryzae]TDV35320.1 hypothetical protein CLV71_13635 [Actinophytocola oryzae]
MAEPESGEETPEKLVRVFADVLRGMRAPGLGYRELERRSGRPHDELHAATSGTTWPDWGTVDAFVTACGRNPDDVRAKWQETNAALGDNAVRFRYSPPPDGSAKEPESGVDGEGKPPRDRRRVRPALVVAAVVVVATVVAVLVIASSSGGGSGSGAGGPGVAMATTTTSSSRTGQSTSSRPTSRDPSGTSEKTTGATPTPGGTTGEDRTATQSPPNSVHATEPPDPRRYENVQEQREVELIQQQGYNWVDIEYWRHDAATPGELQIDPQGVFTNLGAKLTVIADTPQADRDRCEHAAGWRERVEFSELHVGSQLCALSHVGRYGSMVVRLVPGSPGSDGRFTFYGITWN